ncbi:MAG: nucleotidyl transferase AbiEii/AbiGii toxin family protein [Candidatus Micrarchaeota archaeon]
MRIPLSNRLRRREHAEIAALQDEVVEALYSRFPECNLVLHGGTAIWRCYDGNRFSEDLDFYGARGALASGFKEKFLAVMASLGFTVSKFKQTENTVFAKVSSGGAEIRVEISFGGEARGPRGVHSEKSSASVVAGEFEKTDGGALTVLVLSPAALLKEKMAAYSSRFFVRDFYDVYFLSRLVDDAEALRSLKSFLAGAKKPVDERNLETLVYSGVAPSFKQMTETLSSRAGTAKTSGKERKNAGEVK